MHVHVTLQCTFASCAGFVLKKDKQKVEKESEISLEELIEKEVGHGQ